VTDRADDDPRPQPDAAAPVQDDPRTPAAEPAAAIAQHPRRVGLLATVAGTVIVLDLLTKIIAVALLTPYESVRILGGLVYFSLIRNPGAAFSMATGMTWLLALVAIGVVAGAKLVERVPLALVRRVTGVILAALGVVSAVAAIRG